MILRCPCRRTGSRLPCRRSELLLAQDLRLTGGLCLLRFELFGLLRFEERERRFAGFGILRRYRLLPGYLCLPLLLGCELDRELLMRAFERGLLLRELVLAHFERGKLFLQ